MIASSILRRQVWMTYDHEFDHIHENLQRVLKLNGQYGNHSYAEEFTKECSVMFIHATYILEGKADAKLSFGEIWNCRQVLHQTTQATFAGK